MENPNEPHESLAEYIARRGHEDPEEYRLVIMQLTARTLVGCNVDGALTKIHRALVGGQHNAALRALEELYQWYVRQVESAGGPAADTLEDLSNLHARAFYEERRAFAGVGFDIVPIHAGKPN